MSDTTAQNTQGTQDAIQSQLPLFYKRLVPVTPTAYGDKSLAKEANYTFAAKSNAIPLLHSEIPAAIRHYPVVFTDAAPHMPIALVGIGSDRNLQIDDRGHWALGKYIPAYVRRYPFILVRSEPSSESYALCVDAETDLITDGAGLPLFVGGEASEPVKRAMEICQQFEQTLQQTRLLCDYIAELDVLIPGSISARLGDRQLRMEGFKKVDEEKLRALTGDPLQKAARSGLIGLLYGHLFSLSTVQSLVDDWQVQPA